MGEYMSKKFRIGIFISGVGSNMVALVKDMMKKDHPGTPVIVISDKEGVIGLKKARQLGVPSMAIHTTDSLSSKKGFERHSLRQLQKYHVDTVCLAGFMKILSPEFIHCFGGNILNIHPSILPSLKGLNTHKRALVRRLKVHGVTVHEVTEQLDSGIIWGQDSIRINENDTPEILKARLQPIEHHLYAKTLRSFLKNKN